MMILTQEPQKEYMPNCNQGGGGGTVGRGENGRGGREGRSQGGGKRRFPKDGRKEG